MDTQKITVNHTSGELAIRANMDGKELLYYDVILKEGNETVASFWDHEHPGVTQQEALYNATLFAAAPLLLEACQAFLSRFGHLDKGMIKAEYVTDLGRKAIAAATTPPADER